MIRTLLRLVPAAAIVLAACAEPATAPGAYLPRVERDVASGDAGFIHPATMKYREQTHPDASSRSGSATLTVRALLGADGATTLDVTTGTLDEPGAPGAITKVQVKAFNLDGSLASTQNRSGLSAPTYTSSLPGLARHGVIQLQGNVSGIDGRRTDVVTVSAAVNRRPDLTVRSVDGPGSVWDGTPGFVTAAVAEINMDVGAHADCVLRVDGAETQRLPGIWVADGDQVNCRFLQQFAGAGDHAVSVSVENVSPSDWSDANNSAGTTVSVIPPPLAGGNIFVAPPLPGKGSVDDRVITTLRQEQDNTTLEAGTDSLTVKTDSNTTRSRTETFSAALPGVWARLPGTLTVQELGNAPIRSSDVILIDPALTKGGIISGKGDTDPVVTIVGASYTVVTVDGWELQGGVAPEPGATTKDALITFISGTRALTGTTYFEFARDVVFTNGAISGMGGSENSHTDGVALPPLGDTWGLLVRFDDNGFPPLVFAQEAPLRAGRFDSPPPPTDGCTNVASGPTRTRMCVATHQWTDFLLGVIKD